MAGPGPLTHSADALEERRAWAIARRALSLVGLLAAVAFVGWLAHAWYDSRLPGRYNAMEFTSVDIGGGRPIAHDHAAQHVSVASLTGPAGVPDRRITLTAVRKTIRLRSGRTVDGLTFDGRVPGPELVVRQHDLVEVTLVNRDVDDGVSIHWHGVDVPNAEDGVAGVTQDAVPRGGRHVYRFRADQAGTYWYHSHQHSSDEVGRGLYGALVVVPRRPHPRGLDLTAVSHSFGGIEALGASDVLERRAVAPGTPVRVRLLDTDDSPRRYTLSGAPFRVVAIDGTDVQAPATIARQTLLVPAGGRYDVAFTMPATPVRLSVLGTPVGIAFSADGSAAPAVLEFERQFDPASYGARRATPFARFDRSFRLDIGKRPGFLDGRPGFQWTLNGRIYPRVPMFVVRRGETAKITIHNGTKADHPMHLHGHHVLVLTRDGVPVRGRWWVDTLNVEPGETYEVGFRATNPGLWMLHCHNLRHAAHGLTMHLAYAGIATPYDIGGDAGNEPE